MRQRLLATLILVTCACAPTAPAPAAPAESVPTYGYEVVHEYPHDPNSFTEGLFYRDGFLWESTGQEGESWIRKTKLETGEVLQQTSLPAAYFGEGIIIWHGKDGKDKLIQLTYKTQVGFVYELPKLAMVSRFEYPGEGWAMTTDGKNIIMSDGTAQLRYWDPETLKDTGRRLTVMENGRVVTNLNELEWVKGEIFANIWTTDRIARIDPQTGKVKGWIDLSGILNPAERNGQEDVLNGIAYDAQGDRLLVTGKKWSKIYEIKLVKR